MGFAVRSRGATAAEPAFSIEKGGGMMRVPVHKGIGHHPALRRFWGSNLGGG